ncbi:SDR family NAD(P)-dependent oxidoreductase [Thiomicrolovo sp. ZZH C-3]
MITGSSSGLGSALAAHYLQKGAELYGLSRRTPENAHAYSFVACDVSDFDALQKALDTLLDGVTALDLVYLNAGTLGRIQDMSRCSMKELKAQMDTNLWANKVILDYLIQHKIAVGQVVAISSGASQSGSLGWNGYSLSKAALNMMIKLYANEMPRTHLCALAPGLIETPMLGTILYGDHDTERYTTVERLRRSKEDGLVLSPEACAALIDGALDKLTTFPSGEYIDIRHLPN